MACYFLNAYSQRVDYDHTSKWFLGFNIGGTWNSTDVKNKTATGWGFTLGKSYNYNYGKALSFDLRARYLRGFWYGQDIDTTSLSNYTGTALSSYQNSPGYTINNFQADVHRLALELVIHGNRIAERTGFDPYIFGGIGLTWHETFGDLKNDFGNYAYDTLLQNGAISSGTLDNTLDGIYDSPLDGSSNKYKVNVMPSLGFGLGYQVGKRTTIGLEHKTTFTLADNFDGYLSEAPRLKNDRYHYTSLYIQFRFRVRENVSGGNANDNVTDPNNSNNINNYNTVCPAPVISVLQQTVNATNSPYQIEATVSNVNNANEITLSDQNGTNIPFIFLSNQNRIRAEVSLSAGSNTFILTAQNNCGRDSRTITVNYNPCQNPTIVITNPNTRELTVSSPAYVFTANLQNITNQQNISLYLNGIRQTNFTFNTFTGQLQSNLFLVPGLNTIRIDALNNCGSNTASSSINYNNCITPQMQLISPSSSGSLVSTSAFNVRVNLAGFTNRNELSVLHNGVQISNFSINNSVLEVPIQLTIGLNTVTINGTNVCGSDAASFAITYQNCVSPLITLINPSTTISTNTTSAYRLRMKVLNSERNTMQLLLNNQQITNFTFNPTTKILEASITLLAGNNTIIVNASNPCGTAIETIYINNENCKTPTVSINGNNNTTVINPSYTLSAQLQNISSPQGISVSQNGNLINFDYSNGQVTCFTSLQPGINTFVVTGINGCGRDSKTFTVTYNNCIVPQVTLIHPLATGITVGNANYNFQAGVSNVSQSQNITLMLNGVATPFNLLNGVINADFVLREGRNQIQVNVTNPCGSDNEVISLFYSSCKSPVITIQAPNTQITSTNNPSVIVSGNVQNISSAQEITVLLNNVVVPVILTGNSFTATLNFQPGLNSVNISATNACGSDVFVSAITYTNCKTPTITINSTLTANSLTPQVTINASTQNITSAQQLTLTLNGISQVFTYTNNNLSALLNLSNGTNTIVISATNSCGNDIEIIQTNYMPCLGPVLSIISPLSAGLSVNNAPYLFTASAVNVSNLQEISLTLNDVIQQQTIFSNGLISCNLTLQPGINSIVVQANTACGRNSKSTTVIYNNCISPVVTSTIPANAMVTNSNYTYLAQVQNVNANQNITLTLNGQNVSNVNFSGGQVSAAVTLQAGINTFYLSANNTCGNDYISNTVNYQHCETPIVTINNTQIAQSNSANYTILASIQNITSLQNITATLNSSPISQLIFNNGQLVGSTTLQPGLNQFVITATNTCGSDTKNGSVEFINCKQPTVSISGVTGSTVSSASYTLQATIGNITNTQEISLSINGNPTSNFSYTNGQLSFSSNLTPGTNVFVLSVSNACGNASETFVLDYLTCQLPLVSLSANLPNNSFTENLSVTINATIANYDNQTTIQITKNGNVIPGGYTNNNGQLSGTINLGLGTTTIIVTASKPCGQDTKTYVINRCKAPTVTLSSPNTVNSSSQLANYFIQLNLANTDNIAMVTATQNGSTINNLTLSNTILGGQVILQPGLNTFVVSVNNNCGVASTNFSINYAQQNNGTVIPPNGQGSDNNGQKANDGKNKNNTPVTPEPVKPVTPKSDTPKPITPEPVKPKLVTPEPVKPVTPKPVTPEPVKPIKPEKPIKPVPQQKKPEEKGGGK
jgi:hypothetical protein